MPGTDARFFDDDYRRVLAPFHSEADARYETAALREILGLAQSERILDLGCGWGRHLALLDEAGHDVTGADLSFDLLRQVPRRDNAGQAPVRTRAGSVAASGEPRRPPLVAADMRALPLADGAFDVVLNLASSLGLFLDDDHALAALREARRVLRPGGRFLLEGMHRADVEANFATRARWFLDDGTEVRARRRWDPDGGISEEVLRWMGPGGKGEKRHRLRVRSAAELDALLAAAELRVAERLGGWHGAAFEDGSARLILVASAPK